MSIQSNHPSLTPLTPAAKANHTRDPRFTRINLSISDGKSIHSGYKPSGLFRECREPSTFSMNMNTALQGTQPEYDPEMDVVQVLGQIRSKFRMLCSLIGIRPASLNGAISATEAEADTMEVGNGQVRK